MAFLRVLPPDFIASAGGRAATESSSAAGRSFRYVDVAAAVLLAGGSHEAPVRREAARAAGLRPAARGATGRTEGGSGVWKRALSWDLLPCVCPLKTSRFCILDRTQAVYFQSFLLHRGIYLAGAGRVTLHACAGFAGRRQPPLPPCAAGTGGSATAPDFMADPGYGAALPAGLRRLWENRYSAEQHERWHQEQQTRTDQQAVLWSWAGSSNLATSRSRAT
eukprot:SAG11_NODE_3284_length_2552_cov_12.177742_1_plen_221_part_00